MANADAKSGTPAGAITGTSGMRRLRVMVVDDDEMVRHVVTQVVRRRNCDVIAFEDALGCCAYIDTDRECPCRNGETCADVLLTDVKMPGTDGLDFLDALARCKCRIPHKGVMSAFWSAQSLDRARNHGCRIFVKPVGVTEIDRWLAGIDCATDGSRPTLEENYRSPAESGRKPKRPAKGAN